jgi:hypothetical protein
MTEQSGQETLRRVGLIAVLALAAAILPAGPAAAANTLEGTCTLSGWAKFDPPLGNEPREFSFRDHASGTCTGTLNGVPQQDAPVLIRAKGSGTAGCLAGRTMESGRLIFTRGTESDADDVAIRYSNSLVGVSTEYVGTLRGAVSGEGVGRVEILPGESGLAECAAGTLDFVRYNVVARTITPVIG